MACFGRPKEKNVKSYLLKSRKVVTYLLQGQKNKFKMLKQIKKY